MANINTDVNQFPSLTWNHLNINHTHLQNSIQSGVDFSISGLSDGIVLTKKNKSDFSSLNSVCVTGLGQSFDNQFDAVISELELPVYEFNVSGSNPVTPVRLSYEAGAGEYSVADIVINAGNDTESSFILDFSSQKDYEGFLGIRIRVLAKPFSIVHIATVNMLSDGYEGFVSVGSVEEDNACIDIVQLELGGKNICNGATHELSGYKACSRSKISYVVNKDHSLDVNYVARQAGRETSSFMRTDGVVMDCASKVWRGTIDFIKGCKDSEGDEQEDVLLLNPDVVNKTLPVILCGEEDVDGRHGSSIGRLGKDILFYMQSRGIDEKTAQKLMIRAKILSACKDIPDEILVNKIQSFVEGAFVHE